MARFYASIQGNRSETTRTGDANSGITSHTRGWNVGARVSCYVGDDGKDIVQVFRTGGSSSRSPDKLIATFTTDDEG